MQPHNFLAPTQRLAPQLAATPWGGSPPPPPLPENLLLRLHRKLPSEPPASTQEVSESEVPVHVPLRRPRPLRFERLRVSVESIQPRPPRPCEVGRPKGRRRKNRRQSHKFFKHRRSGWYPNSPATPWGGSPPPPPLPENLLLRLHRKLPSEPPASTQEVSESENRPATRGTAHSEVQGDERGNERGK